MPRTTDAGNPSDWLGFAKADMDAVDLMITHRVSHDVCRSKLAEAFEKTLKADLTSRGWFLRKIHDLQALVVDLRKFDPVMAAQIKPMADALADAYIETRYPGFDLEDANWNQLIDFAGQTRRYMESIEERLTG